MSRKTLDHIEERHPEMTGHEAAIKEAIEAPDARRISTERTTCVAYEAFGTGPASMGVRVLIEYADSVFESGTTTGKLITAYPLDAARSSKLGPMMVLGKTK